jgi:hypothetical protein
MIEPDLVQRVLEEVQTGQVQIGETGRGTISTKATAGGRIEAPYLQLVMTRVWEKEQSTGSTALPVSTFLGMGRAEQIVKSHLDIVMSRLSAKQRDIAARVFQLLVTPSGTKIAHTARDLADTVGECRQLLEEILAALSDGFDRIRRPVAALPERPNERRYEIFHDRLASAVLDWRAHYLKEKEVTEAKREDLPRSTL